MLFKNKTECKECKRLREELSRVYRELEHVESIHQRYREMLQNEYVKKVRILETENGVLKSLVEELEEKRNDSN